MVDLFKVGDYVTHLNPDFFHHFFGRIIAVEASRGARIAVIEKADGSRTSAHFITLKRLELLDVFVLNIQD
jgi:hypothetical protein